MRLWFLGLSPTLVAGLIALNSVTNSFDLLLLDHSLEHFAHSTKLALIKAIASLQQWTHKAKCTLYGRLCSLCFIYMCMYCKIIFPIHFKVRFFKIDPTCVKQDLNFFQSAAKGAVAIVRYYFYSGTAAVAPLLNLTKSGSDAIYKVTVAHLWWESYRSLSIRLSLFRVSALFAYDKTVINQRRVGNSAFGDHSEENSVWILKWTTLLGIFCKLSFTTAVTFCYQAHAPKTATHIPTAGLRCHFRCHWCRNLSEVNCILHWIVLTLSTLQMGITLAVVVA